MFKTKYLPDELYWSKGVPLDGRYHPQKYKGDYIWEMPSSMPNINKVNGKVKPLDNSIGAYKVNTEPLYISDAKLYKEDWLRGYKQIKQQGGNIPISSNGVYDFPGQEVIVPTNNGQITMSKVNYPIKGTDEFGNTQMMMPGKEYQFKGKIIHEEPVLSEKEKAFLTYIKNNK